MTTPVWSLLTKASSAVALGVPVARHRRRWCSTVLIAALALAVDITPGAAETISATSPTVTLTLPSIERPPSTKLRKERAMAVIVGNRDYRRSDIPKVPYAIRDVEAVQSHLRNVLGYLPQNIIRLENATLSDLYSAFGSPQNPVGDLHRRTSGGRWEVFVYYSGHGAPGLGTPSATTRGFLVPVDGNPDHIENTGFALDTLYQNLARLKTEKLVVVLDTCFSGDSAGGSLFPKASPARLTVENPLLGLNDAFILAAAQGSEVANWYAEKRHGLLTYWFLLALQTLGPATGRGELTAAALEQFVTPRVREMAQRLGRSQSPQVLGPEGRKLAP